MAPRDLHPPSLLRHYSRDTSLLVGGCILYHLRATFRMMRWTGIADFVQCIAELPDFKKEVGVVPADFGPSLVNMHRQVCVTDIEYSWH